MLTSQILIQLIVILTVVQIFGSLCKRIGLQWVIGEILAGLALGPTFLGAFWPHLETIIFPVSALPTLQTLGDIGLILYMFSLSSHIDVYTMISQGRKVIATSFSGIVLPLLLGCILALLLYRMPAMVGPRAQLLTFTLLIGIAMAITAFPVLARLLSERHLLGTKIGILALSCAAVDDVIAWCLLAMVISLIHAQGPLGAVAAVALTLLFAAVMFFVVRPFLLYLARKVTSEPVLWTLYIVLLLLSAYITNAIGIHPIFGAFLMGIILPRRKSTADIIRSIERVNTSLFLPLYFVYNGLRTQLGLIHSPTLWLVCLLVLTVACIGKVCGVTLCTRLFGDGWLEGLTLGILMNTRGLVELIVINIGFDLGILSPTLFAMLVIMALITTMLTPLLLTAILRKKQDQLAGYTAIEASGIPALQEQA